MVQNKFHHTKEIDQRLSKSTDSSTNSLTHPWNEQKNVDKPQIQDGSQIGEWCRENRHATVGIVELEK